MLLALLLELVTLETRIEPETCFVYQPLPVTVIVRYDAEQLRARGVQLFSRELDLPVRLEAPWLEGIPGTILRPAADGGEVTFALNDEIVEGELVDGALLIRRTYLPTRPGELLFPAPVLRYATATKFREDFIHGRMPVDRTDFVIEGAPRRVLVLPLPEEGRPRRFCGAVGRFAVRAEADPGELEPGRIFRLTLRIEGAGNLAHFDTPRLDGIDGFHIYGSVDDRAQPVRTVVYDLAPLDASVRQVPAIEFGYFDPERGAYRVAATRPIPIVVRAEPVPETATPWLRYASMLVAALLAVLILVRVRRRRVPGAADRAAAHFAAGGSFEEFLATLLDAPAAAVISPELAARLEGAGISRPLAARAAALVEKRVAARYGGNRSDAADRAEAAALVEAIRTDTRDRPEG